MRVVFSSNRLERCYEHQKEAAREWGEVVGRAYIARIDILASVETFGDLYKLPTLRLHPLKGERKDQYAIIVIGRWRLLISYLADDLTIRVDEVSNHYDD